MNKIILGISIIILFCCCKTSVVKKNCVSSTQEAMNIAEKEWLKVYGQKIYDNKPFTAKLMNDSIWVVEGTFYQDSIFSKRGGVPYAEINAIDCNVIKLTHGK